MDIDFESNNYALSDCAWWDTSPIRRPTWLSKDCSGRVGETILGVLCEEHFNAGKEPIVAEPERMYLVCACGEAFDSIETASEHAPVEGSFTIQPESEAM